MMINNYNQEWIKAWDGNMDLQVCLDTFAIVTYITDYYMKDESGMSSHLQAAAKECKGKERLEQLRYITRQFLTHREMGESEAYYRMLPELHLSESNIKCTFAPTGFSEDRSKFFIEVQKERVYEDQLIEGSDDEDESGTYRPASGPSDGISIPGYEGKVFKEATSKLEKYMKRPHYLEDMCFAQFITCYDMMTRAEGEKKFKGVDDDILFKSEDDDSLQQVIITSEGTGKKRLPQYLKLS